MSTSMPATATVFLLMAAIGFRGSGAEWCVCKPEAGVPALQKALDYACGHGADCAPVLPSGSCHSPDTVAAHCSYAANSYYQRSSSSSSSSKDATCDFGGTAALSTTDPSSGSCKFPATPSAAGTGNGTGTGSSTPGSTNPATPSTGGSFTTPIGASGPAASFPVNSRAAAAAAAAPDGLISVLLIGVAVVLSFMANN